MTDKQEEDEVDLIELIDALMLMKSHDTAVSAEDSLGTSPQAGEKTAEKRAEGDKK
ncbi:hypothetical protein [Escherichia coli]|uniref:hypothetical protein n=1 Tax=Escherichia coli TaxID=562 RepID=UPI00215847DE|nr:hypothetical protein [Escherichia coli]